MPKLTDLPSTATVLWRWMNAHDVKLGAFAKKLKVSSNYLSDLRRGVYTPSDDLKLKIAKATADHEAKAGSKTPRGVQPGDWFPVLPTPGSPRSRATGRRRPSV